MNYSVDVYNNAEAAGIETAWVTIDFKGESVGHALNAFLTIDYGLVFFDCTEEDTVAYVSVGHPYRAVDLGVIPPTMFRIDSWWSNLRSGYYIPDSTGQPAIVNAIDIWW